MTHTRRAGEDVTHTSGARSHCIRKHSSKALEPRKGAGEALNTLKFVLCVFERSTITRGRALVSLGAITLAFHPSCYRSNLSARERKREKEFLCPIVDSCGADCRADSDLEGVAILTRILQPAWHTLSR